MTNKEVEKEMLEQLKKADALLEEYIGTVRVVAAELARRKSLAVWGNATTYAGRLGCYEEGIDAICLHNIYDAKTRRRDKHHKAIKFDRMWHDKIRAAGIKNISIQGYF
jgi:hypothetical protein